MHETILGNAFYTLRVPMVLGTASIKPGTWQPKETCSLVKLPHQKAGRGFENTQREQQERIQLLSSRK